MLVFVWLIAVLFGAKAYPDTILDVCSFPAVYFKHLGNYCSSFTHFQYYGYDFAYSSV